jgi:glycosyltransferase involved in cell wall biosynthesis
MPAPPKTIVFVCNSAAMSGVEFSLIYLLQRLDRMKWMPVVLCPREGDLTAACHEIGVATYRIKAPAVYSTSFCFGTDRRLPNPAALAWDALSLTQAGISTTLLMHKLKPRLVVTKGMFAHVYGGLAARQLGIPCIWHLQDLISERHSGIYRRFFAALAARIPTSLICDGSLIREQLAEPTKDRTTVIFNGVDTSLFRPGQNGAHARQELGIAPDVLVMGCVARLTPWKGQHFLIDAFARVASAIPQTVLLIVGGSFSDSRAYGDRLRRMAAEADLEHRIVFTGHRTDLSKMFAVMDLFVHTAIEKDTCPLALVSAMSSGLPIVAFDIDGVREMFRHASNGLLVPRADTKALANILLRICEDPRLRRQLGDSARRTAVDTFSLERHCERMQSAFAEACG